MLSIHGGSTLAYRIFAFSKPGKPKKVSPVSEHSAERLTQGSEATELQLIMSCILCLIPWMNILATFLKKED